MIDQGADFSSHPRRQSRSRRSNFLEFRHRQFRAQLQNRVPGFFRSQPSQCSYHFTRSPSGKDELPKWRVNYPVDQIRDSLDAGRPDDFMNLDMVPQPRHFAIWRSHAGASVKPLSPRASVFIQVVLAQSDIGAALRRSTGRSAYGRAAAAIYNEIATNSFALISSVR
jgi:hypothetical protein